MRLYVLRHGDASYDAPDDSSRQLSPKGIATLNQLHRVLRPKEFHKVDEIWHSPLVRAAESARILRETCHIDAPLRTKAGMQPEDDPEPLCSELVDRGRDLVLVGHNPHLTFLAAHLLNGRANQASIVFKKAGLLCLEQVGPPSGALPGGHWALCFFLIPRVTGMHHDKALGELD